MTGAASTSGTSKSASAAYVTFLKSGAYQSLFATKAVTVAFTTSVGMYRLEQMREWTRLELTVTNESGAIAQSFCFTNLTYPLAPRQLWLEPCWYPPYAQEQAMPLLGE